MKLFLVFIGSFILLYFAFIISNHLFGNAFDVGGSIFYPLIFSLIVTGSWAIRFKKREEKKK